MSPEDISENSGESHHCKNLNWVPTENVVYRTRLGELQGTLYSPYIWWEKDIRELLNFTIYHIFSISNYRVLYKTKPQTPQLQIH